MEVAAVGDAVADAVGTSVALAARRATPVARMR
jgi:hypothetical protein